MHQRAPKAALNAAQQKLLREEQDRVPAELRTAFETEFNAWKATWFSGAVGMSSDPHARTAGREYGALLALGPPVLPLVVAKLAEPENFMALQLFDAIQPDEGLVVQFGPDDERILEGEQGRARRVVQIWLENR